MKTFQKLILTGLMCLSSVLHAESVQHGGMSGGGGNSIIDTERADVLTFAFTARYDLYLMSIANEKLRDVIEHNQIYLAKGPCYDKNGKPRDGSVISPFKNSICISQSRIEAKVPAQSARAQVLGLIAHEYAHLAGANEKEAVRIQQNIIFDVTYNSDYHVPDISALSLALDRINQNFSLDQAIEGWIHGCMIARNIRNALQDGSTGIAVLDASPASAIWFLKAQLLEMAPCDNTKLANPNALRYADLFGGNETLTDTELFQRLGYAGAQPTGEVISRIRTLNDVARAQAEIKTYADALSQKLVMLKGLRQAYPLKK